MARKCNFCSEVESADRRLLADINGTAFICEHCITAAYKVLYGEENREQEKEERTRDYQNLTPKELKAVLDNYVIGQDKAKKVFSVGVYNHYKRILEKARSRMIRRSQNQISC